MRNGSPLDEEHERSDPMPLIGLTGGIAAGKSLVTDYLKSKGVLVVDSDPDR